MDFKNFYEGIIKQLSERLASPFIFAFSIAFLIYNYDVVLHLLAFQPVDSKIGFVAASFGWDSLHSILRILVPILSGLFFVYVWPKLDYLFYRYWIKEQAEFERKKLEALKKKPINQTRADELWKHNKDLIEKLDSQEKTRTEETRLYENELTKINFTLEGLQAELRESKKSTDKPDSRSPRTVQLLDQLSGKHEETSFELNKGLNYLTLKGAKRVDYQMLKDNFDLKDSAIFRLYNSKLKNKDRIKLVDDKDLFLYKDLPELEQLVNRSLSQLISNTGNNNSYVHGWASKPSALLGLQNWKD